MKLLSFSILFGSLLISFNYVWINRISVTKLDSTQSQPPSMVLLNKWTGNHCVFLVSPEWRDSNTYYEQKECEVDDMGKVTFP